MLVKVGNQSESRKDYLLRKLHPYLKDRFYKDNHPKYHHYFEEWVTGLTKIQLYYFNKDSKIKN